MPRTIKNIGLYIIVLLILSVVTSSFSIYTKESTKKADTELPSKKAEESSQTISKPSELEAVIPFIEFDLIKYSYLISKLDFQKVLTHEIYVSHSLYISKYFKTLFCFVISPNAP